MKAVVPIRKTVQNKPSEITRQRILTDCKTDGKLSGKLLKARL
ncbi:hypothetical protein HMPREF9442_03322 [Paraprevotella xylaniphila YIT 11841]|uniref:Uncharacterized protein n=1 Tax=Paraprevotella xylaniphila YIT 11841 TaxID=762982 RepID=F3QYM8_9BACT|nr:hypothetical protein HMPREF9442_03322 [Paraprevotella xylaniphila YIT 11841]